MNKVKIQKSIEVNAPKDKVWDVLFNDQYTRIWYAVFHEGSHAVTDWKIGSKVIFQDGDGNGIVGHIIQNKPGQLISIEYNGVVYGGKEDYASSAALEFKGAREIYELSGSDAHTQVSVECDMPEKYFDGMSAAWDKALIKIKELSEVK